MSSTDLQLLADLKKRDLIAQSTAEDGLESYLNEAPRTLYSGFDPTADSLHIGHLVPLLILARFQRAGHHPIALVGGATGLIGDPSFKAAERQLNTPDVVAGWSDKIRAQVSRFIDFEASENPAQVVNNYDWTGSLNVLDFLRDVGKHFSVNNMINKESVQQRLNREGAGISFTEFSYSLLQAMDFAELNRLYGCTLQVGGSDQWGNIVGGIDLCRRQNQVQAYGLTVPLVTKADGTKFGKTESGAVWLDPTKTSPYMFYQFWLNVADADVYKFLRYFTFLTLDTIEEIESEDRQATGRPKAQGVLAREMTKMVHGEEGLAAALRITDALFNGDLNELTSEDLTQLALDGLPCTELSSEMVGLPLTSLFSECGMVKSGKEVKDALSRSAVAINGIAIGVDQNMNGADLFRSGQGLHGRYFLVKLGKKKSHLFQWG